MRALIVSAVTLLVAGLAAATHVAEEAAAADPRTAVARSLDYIEREGFAWMDGRVPIQDGKGCVSCHHVSYGIWSLREAQRQGIERAGTQVDLLERRAYTHLAEAGCRAFSCAPLLFARDEAAPGVDRLAMSKAVGEIQEDDGHWRARGQFPTQRRPIEESDAAATMWALLAVGSNESAMSWLDEAETGESTEWFLGQLLVAHGAGDSEAVASYSTELLARQNADGGWPWQPDQISDAMTTGQAVYALALTGTTPATRTALRQGVDYLLESQQADGTWVTDSELVSTEHDDAKDYIYTYWGTTWAAIGLSRAIDVLSEE